MNDAEERLLRDLAEALREALSEAIADARRKHAGEHFYAYILYTLPFFNYAVLLFNTEDGLARIATNKKEEDELRWCPPDWECTADAEEMFKDVNQLLSALETLQGHQGSGCDKRHRVFMDVLKLLDCEGAFGTGIVRESAVANIMWGDQDVRAHVESARELNPKASYLKYARQELPSLHAWEKEIEGSRSMYKNESLARIRRTIAQVESDLRPGAQ